MKTKKSGVYIALAVVLLITAALIASCVEPVNPGGLSVPQKGNPDTPLPEGMGYLSVIIGRNSNLRTVLPSSPSFDSYKISIAPRIATSDPNPGSTTVTDQALTVNGSGEGTIAVTAGDYTVTVKAYINDSSPSPVAILAALGIDETVTVTSSGGSADITLKEITDSGSGTFTWNLTLPTGFGTVTVPATASATMNLTTFPAGGSTTVTGVDLLTAATSPAGGSSLSSGFYLVTVTLAKTGFATFTKSEIVHIYAGMTTNYTNSGAAFPAPVANLYDVTYRNVIGAGNANNDTGNVLLDDNKALTPPNDPQHFQHGTTIRNFNHANGPGAGSNPVNTTNPGYIFDGWFQDAAYTAKGRWVFDETLIIRDTTLYAKWNAPITLTATIDYEHPSDFTLELDDGTTSASFSQAALLTEATSVAFELDNTSGFYSIRWMNGSTVLTANAGSPEILTLNLASPSNVNYLVIGQPYVITVIVQLVEDGPYFSGEFTLTITP